MARLTWQQVDAPNLLAAAVARGEAASSFNNSLSTLGSVFDGQALRQKEAAAEQLRKDTLGTNAKAVQSLLGVQSVDAFDKAAAGGNIWANLGLDKAAPTEDMLKLALGWRERNEGDRTTDFNYGAAVYDQGMLEYKDGRAKAEDVRTDETRAIADKALQDAWATANQSVSPVEAGIALRNSSGDAREALAREQALTQFGGAFATSGSPIADPATAATIKTIGANLTKATQDLEYEFAGNPTAQLWNESGTRYGGYDTPLNGMIERIGAEVGDENQEAFGQSKGKVTSKFNEYQKAYPDMPQGLIATVMENTLRDDSYAWLFGGDNVKFDDRSIRQQLDSMNTPEGRNALTQVTTDYATRKQGIADTSAQVEKLTGEIGILQDKKPSATRDAEIAKKQAEIQTLFEGMRTPVDPAQELAQQVVPPPVGAAAAREVAGPAPVMSAQAPAAINPAVVEELLALAASGGGGDMSYLSPQPTAPRPAPVRAPALTTDQVDAGYQDVMANIGQASGGDMSWLRPEVVAPVAPVQAPAPVAPPVAAAAPAPAPEVVAKAVTEVQQIAQSAGFSGSAAASVAQALVMMNDPSLDPVSRKRAKVIFDQFLSQARRSSELTDDQVEKLSNPEAWLSGE